MKIICFSDIHGEYNFKLPEGDVLVFCGDFTANDSSVEIYHFIEHLSHQKHKCKIVIAGNHDWICEKDSDVVKATFKDNGITYLQNELFTYKGIKFYGTADQLEFCNWAFNRTQEQLKMSYSNIPEDTDVLITHCPPYMILDRANKNGQWLGSTELRTRIRVVRPKLNVFGHIHGGYGQDGFVKTPEDTFTATKFVNCSLSNENYELVNKPIAVEI